MLLKKHPLKHFHACKGLSNDDAGAARGTVFQEVRPGAGFETGDFVKETLGGLPKNDSSWTMFRCCGIVGGVGQPRVGICVGCRGSVGRAAGRDC